MKYYLLLKNKEYDIVSVMESGEKEFINYCKETSSISLNINKQRYNTVLKYLNKK